jgi:hypothetical protein
MRNKVSEYLKICRDTLQFFARKTGSKLRDFSYILKQKENLILV